MSNKDKPPKRLVNRARSGCATCKRRRKKCDESKPKCGACRRLNLDCQYVKKLYWYESNHYFRDHYTVRSRPTKFMITTSCDDIVWDTRSNKRNVRSHPIHEDEILSDESQLQEILDSDQNIETQLFDHFVEVVSKKKVFSDNEFNEFRSIVVPNSIVQSSLFQSVIALAASDLVRQSPAQYTYYAQLKNKYKNEAINLMYNLLDSPSDENINEILISIVVLCSLEIGENGNNSWVNYLNQGALIFHRLDDKSIFRSKSLLFCYRYFILRYVLFLTTLKQDEYLDHIERYPIRLIDDLFNVVYVDYMFGCSPRLLKIIHDITHLKNTLRSDTSSDEVLKLHEAIGKMEKRTERGTLKISENLYLNATKLYFESSFKKYMVRLSTKIDAHTVISDTFSIFNEFMALKDLTLVPSWTSLMLSVSDIDDYGRIKLLEYFHTIEKNWPKSSASLLKDAVETIWKLRDLNSDLDWRHILSAKGYKLALT